MISNRNRKNLLASNFQGIREKSLPRTRKIAKSSNTIYCGAKK